MRTCTTPGCEQTCEGTTYHCGTHNREIRKREQSAAKLMDKKKYEMPKVSEKQKVKNKLYSKQRKEHLARFPFCQLKLTGCTKVAHEVHHSEGRGENTNKAESFMSACPECHHKLHNVLSAKEARELGLKK